MKKISELGICPHCGSDINAYKTKSHKRFAKCGGCNISYPLPTRGTMINSALECPIKKFPIIIIDVKDRQAYFWAEGPCFNCKVFEHCERIQELKNEFTELKVYGY